MSASINVDQARAFLARLDPEATKFTLQTFDDTDAEREDAAKVLHIDPANGALRNLAARNIARVGVFVTVNETDLRGRKKDNIKRVRAVFVDLDAETPEEARQLLAAVLAAPLMPHIITASSTCGFHCYWRVDDCPLEDFERVQLALAARFDGDANVHDLPRVLRLPGFLHNKGEPFLTHQLEGIGFDGPPYSIAEIVGELNLDMSAATKPATSAAPKAAVHVDAVTLCELRSALCAIPADDRDVWVRMGQALVRLGDGGRALWFSWAQTSEKYDPVDAGRCWRSFKGERTGYAAVFAEAQRHGWQNPRAGSDGDVREARTAGSLLVRADTIKPRPIDWIWRGYAARGKLHIVAGDPGTNKTTIVAAMIATVSVGGRWPDGTQADLGDSIIWSGEDAYDDTLVPRLIANGADMTRVHFVGRKSGDTKRRPFDPSRDMPDLALDVSRVPRPAIVMLDPVVSTVRGDTNTAGDSRRGLQPFVDLCEQTGAAGIGITHFSKGTSGKTPLERVTGSLAFGAAPRIVLACAKVDHEHGGGRMIIRAKSNIGKEGDGFQYDIDVVTVEGCETIRTRWGRALTGDPSQLFKTMALVPTPDGAPDSETARFVRELILEAGGTMTRKDVLAAAKTAGFSESAVDRARGSAGIRHRSSGFGVAKRSEWTTDPFPSPLNRPK